jgi:hypothetical protein
MEVTRRWGGAERSATGGGIEGSPRVVDGERRNGDPRNGVGQAGFK